MIPRNPLSLVLCGILLAASSLPVQAFELTTPVVFDSTNKPTCILYNLDATKTCVIDETSGLYYGATRPPTDLTPAIFAVPLAASPGGIWDAGSLTPVCAAYTGCMCRFVVTGCSKKKVRAVLSFDGGATVLAQ